MADTQTAPHPATQPTPPTGGSVEEAREALLSLLDPEEETPIEEEATPTEEEESTEETQDESFEEESEEESEEEEDEEESEESAEDQEEEEEPLFTVTANGEEIEVTYDELLKGYSRQADYTKKTQDIAQQRKEYEQAKQQYEASLPELQNLKEQYVQVLNDTISNSMAGLERFNIDWDRLKEDDRDEYLIKRDEFRQAQDELRGHQSRREYEQQQLSKQQQSEMKKVLHEETQKLVSVMPEWGDNEKRKEIITGIREYATSHGYSQQELATLADHRALIMLHKAMQFDNISQSDIKAKKIKNKPKVIRSGKGKSSKENSKKKRAVQMKRLQGTGRVDDASALLEDFIDI
tara:strand:- start:203 stop:1252 length:1050 start_codon:yes stop_codon:yes gene_type:complete